MFENEKIVHNRSMRDYLVKNGGVLLKTKKDLRDKSREIYIFRADSVNELMAKYVSAKNIGGQDK